MRISIVGAGYVGLCTGVAFAQKGHDVVIVDVNPERVERINNAVAPFHEPGLEEALAATVAAGRLHATTTMASAVRKTEATLICVGTPSSPEGGVDLSQVHAAVDQVCQTAPDGHGIVIKSTVIPGTTSNLGAPHVWMASNPEFLREGQAMIDATSPSRILVGCDDRRGLEWLRRLYGDATCPVVELPPTAAEMAKYASNALLATKISFANEMANLCSLLGVDWYDAVRGMDHDSRISTQFLEPGAGYGGSCFPKDVRALAHVAKQHGVRSSMLEASLQQNEEQPHRIVETAATALGGLGGKRIALLGLAFKAETDDVRETRALPIHEGLVAAGANVICHDPVASQRFLAVAPHAAIAQTVTEALRGADACIIQTAWGQYRELTPAHFLGTMAHPLVVDGRRTYEPRAMVAAGVDYRAVGFPASSLVLA